MISDSLEGETGVWKNGNEIWEWNKYKKEKINVVQITMENKVQLKLRCGFMVLLFP